jgi:hypothetical protein
MRKFGMMLAAAMLVTGPAMADVKAGVDAWARGDFRAAVEEWRGPAVAGDADAQFNLGQAYKLGRGVPLDPALAESWFRKAALQGHVQAQDNYALALFQAGRKAEAVPYLEKSVARGEPRTQLVYGTMLFNGDGVARDYPRAYALMTLASQKGLKSAGETLAQMDQYVSAQDRERGTALAEQYAAQARATTPSVRSIATADVPPSRPGATYQPADTKPAPVPAPTATPPASRPAVTRPKPAAAPTPTPKPAPVAAATPTRGNWRIQLGAFRDRGNAEALWTRVRGRLSGAQPAYVATGGVTRLQATGFPSKAAATRACAASGTPCVVVAP